MKNILLNYIVQKFLKTFVVMVLFFYSFGIILNLFEEIEFFKNLDVNILKPLVLTSVYIPSLIIKILPFIIFISSMWFVLKIRNNRDLSPYLHSHDLHFPPPKMEHNMMNDERSTR